MNESVRTTRRRFLVSGVASVALGPPAAALAASKQDGSPVTPPNIEGPFYRPDAPFRSRLREDDPEGELLIVSGVVTGYPDRAPLPGAIVDVWHANHLGHYDNEAPGYDPGQYRLRGRIRTDASGRYELETVLPAGYGLKPGEMRPAHIHFKVFAERHSPLTTQLYFEGDPHLEVDESVKPQLVRKLHRHEDAKELAARGLDRPFYSCSFSIALPPLNKAGYLG